MRSNVDARPSYILTPASELQSHKHCLNNLILWVSIRGHSSKAKNPSLHKKHCYGISSMSAEENAETVMFAVKFECKETHNTE